MKSFKIQVAVFATILLASSVLFRVGPLVWPVRNIGLTQLTYQSTINCFQLQLGQTGANVYNPVDHADLRQPNLDGYFTFTPPLVIELRQLSQNFFTWLINDSGCNTITLLSLGLDSLVALVAFVVLIYGFGVKPRLAFLVSLFGYALNFAAFFGNISTPSVTPLGTILLLLLTYFFSHRFSQHPISYACGLGGCLGLLMSLHTLFIFLLPLIWIATPKPYRHWKIFSIFHVVVMGVVSLTYGLWGFQAIPVFWTQLIPLNRTVIPESVFTLVPWFGITVGQIVIGSQLIIGVLLYVLIISLLYKKAITFFTALLYTLVLMFLFQTNFALDFAVSALFVCTCLALMMQRKYTAIAWTTLQWVLGIVVVFVTVDKIPQLFFWQHQLQGTAWYLQFQPYLVPFYIYINLTLTVIVAYFFVKPQWFKVGAMCLLLFVASLTVRFYLLQSLPYNYQTGYNYDAQIYIYQSQLAGQGINIYNLSDHPELRDSPLNNYSGGEPPLSMLVLAVVGRALSAPVVTNVNGGAFTLIFFFIDSLVSVVIFLLLIFLRPTLKLWGAAALVMLWYGVSIPPLIVNVMNINIKPLYILLLLPMVGLIYYLEINQRRLSERTLARFVVLCGIFIAVLAAYKQLTLVLFPFYWFWVWRLRLSKKVIYLNVIIMLAVFFAGFIPYYPYSWASVSGRSIRSNIVPSHTSIFLWLPWWSGLHTILNFITLGILAVMLWLRKLTFTAVAVWSMVSLVIFTTEGSLDRFLVAFILLIFYCLLTFSKKQVLLLTLAHTIIAVVLVTAPNYLRIPVLYWEYYLNDGTGVERNQALYVIVSLLLVMIVWAVPKLFHHTKHRFIKQS